MQKNPFGKTSSLSLTADCRDGHTVLSDVKFTAPYKIMQPFSKSDGGIQVMLLAASAGIMEGDRQDFRFEILPGAELEFLSQSYDKIHQMKEGSAKRTTTARVCSGASFIFRPQPTIPFADSAYESEMEIFLEDESSRFFFSEILSGGRHAMGEDFAYRFYRSLIQIRRGEKLIYRDNTRYEPRSLPMDAMGMYESYTHLLNIFLTRPGQPQEFRRQVQLLLDGGVEFEGGITELAGGDFAVRALGRRAQVLENLSAQIQNIRSAL